MTSKTEEAVDLDAIRARHAAASRGPWRWFGYMSNRDVSLEGRGVTVMDFVRWGMSCAQPRWSVHGILEKLADLIVPDTAAGRGRVTDINHPDARFIASSWQDVKDLLVIVDGLRTQLGAKAQGFDDATVTAGKLALERMDLRSNVKKLEDALALDGKVTERALAIQDAHVDAHAKMVDEWDKARREAATLQARVAELEAQLPEGMKHCTIVFKECSLGHAWLTGTNWVEHGCPTCELRKVESERDAIQAQVERLRKSMDTAGHMIGIGAPATAEVVLREALSTPPTETHPTKRKRSTHDDRTCGACTPEADAHAIALSMAPAANPPAVPDGSSSDADFVTARNTLARSLGAASYNDAFYALLRLGLKAGKWDAAVLRAEDDQGLYARFNGSTLTKTTQWVLHGDEKDGAK